MVGGDGGISTPMNSTGDRRVAGARGTSGERIQCLLRDLDDDGGWLSLFGLSSALHAL
jgi:hypothetical protein